MTEPPPPELAKLFAAEKAAPAVSAATRVALRARLTASLGHLPLGSAAATAVLGGTGKALAILALVVGAGAGTVGIIRHGHAPDPPTNIAQPSEPRPVVQADIPARVEPALEPISPKPITARPSSQRAPEKPVSQTALLEQAWAALAADRPAQALELSREDARLHPHGVLDEERDALQIVALAKLQHRDQARSAASDFFERYPESVHRALIERALESEPTP